MWMGKWTRQIDQFDCLILIFYLNQIKDAVQIGFAVDDIDKKNVFCRI